MLGSPTLAVFTGACRLPHPAVYSIKQHACFHHHDPFLKSLERESLLEHHPLHAAQGLISDGVFLGGFGGASTFCHLFTSTATSNANLSIILWSFDYSRVIPDKRESCMTHFVTNVPERLKSSSLTHRCSTLKLSLMSERRPLRWEHPAWNCSPKLRVNYSAA